jgi:hypothetical protein
MKILFVEDELSKNIPRIIRLFRKYLGEKRIRKLEEMEADVYGIGPDQIKSIIEETNMIDIEYRFPDALYKVINQHDRYSLFIIDRNLVESEYDFYEVKNIDSDYSKEQYERYYEREGDHLLFKLLLLHVDVKEKFFYLTAYSADDEIRGHEDMKGLFEHFGHFKDDNLIEKGNELDFAKLINRIDNNPVLSLQHANRGSLDILRNHVDCSMADRFLKVLVNKDIHERIVDNLTDLRTISHQIFEKYSKNNPTIQHLSMDQTKRMDMLNLLRETNQINSIIRNFLISIQKIGSDFGAHTDIATRDIYPPTTYTVNSLIYALKDIVRWFGKACTSND